MTQTENVSVEGRLDPDTVEEIFEWLSSIGKPGSVTFRTLDYIQWLQNREASLANHVAALEKAIRHVINDSPGTPQSVKEYLRRALTDSEDQDAAVSGRKEKP